MDALQGGGDGVMVAATGSGKSLNIQLHSLADHAARVQADPQEATRCHPVDLALAPLTATAAALGASADAFFLDVACRLQLGGDGAPAPRALYVDRSGASHSSATPLQPVRRARECPSGHKLEWHRRSGKSAHVRAARCDGGCRSDLQTNTPRWSCAVCDFDLCAVCGGGLAVSPQPTGATQLAEDCGDVGASLPVIMPTSLPCLMCDACTDPAFPPAKRSRLGPSGCQFPGTLEGSCLNM
jgi:hypothetical protein